MQNIDIEELKKQAKRIYKQQWRNSNKEHIKEYNKQWRIKNSK